MMFWLVEHHHWSLTELEGLVPFERDIYIALIKKSNEEVDNTHATSVYEQMKKEQERTNING